MDYSQIDLYEFLTESELQHYYNGIKNELKITNAAQFKYATDEDLKHIGLSRPEVRRLRKFYDKYFPHGYLSKIKRLLQAPTAIVKRDDPVPTISLSSTVHSSETFSLTKSSSSPSKVPNNKHIIPADSISVNKQLGTGEFGIVQQGVWTNGTERIQVAIKCLCRERMQSNPMEFLKEAAIMHSIEHENIVRLYGVVLATDSLMLVTELAHLRSLLECLKDSGLRVSFLTIPTLCEFAMQICNGMSYLENKRLIHRDLAARNILVFSKDKVKISDFGLSRALGVGKDYYKTNFNVNLKLPIAWCAPECINYLRFTNASDVWAYGVCLWEMFSYGFQPWAALTGLEILEAIDAPNFQRLEQPECCPREYYTLMMKCWQDDATKRPKFSEIYEILPDMKPEQLKAVTNCCEIKKDHLMYRQGDIISVLDRNTGTPFWKGVLSSGKTGFFNPSNTVAYLEGLPSSNRDSFCRVNERSSKRKLRTEMISKPQNDLKHTGHVGIDGASFGDVAFLSNTQNYSHVPHQIVTPYKPSEDIEQTPLLLPPTPTSPDSLQTASGYFSEATNATLMNPSFISSTENTPKHIQNGEQTSFQFPGQARKTYPGVNFSTNPFTHKGDDETNVSSFAMQNNNYGIDGKTLEQQHITAEALWKTPSGNNIEDPHEYHEISDDEITADKLDFGPSLLDEINSMFGSISTSINQPKSPDLDTTHDIGSHKLRKCNSNAADGNTSKAGVSSTSKKKTAGSVKPISVKDEKILNQAIEIANEISARSMIDLVSDHTPAAQSPKRKFSFRFPHLTNNGSVHDKSTSTSNASGIASNSSHSKCTSPYSKKKNFTEELKNIPDLQSMIGEEGREAYNSLIDRKTAIGFTVGLNPASNLLRQLDTNEFEIATARTLPRSMQLCNDDSADSQFQKLTRSAEKHEPQNAIPLQDAPRPMTLPTRGAINRAIKAEIICKNASSSKNTENTYNNNNRISLICVDPLEKANIDSCESPSYLSNTSSYKFPEKSGNSEVESNPIPLPPREGKKHIKINPKRHVRKYPLIIPANGVQRTLNKVTEKAANDEDLKVLVPGLVCQSSRNLQRMTCEVVATVRTTTRSAQPKNTTPNGDSPVYQNIEKKTDDACLDSASLQFESILEADINQGNVLQSPDVTDGFYNFSIQKDNFNKSKAIEFDANKIPGLYVNEDEQRNLDIERNMDVTQPTVSNGIPSGKTAKESSNEKETAKPSISITCTEGELAENALFKKVRESADLAMNKASSVEDTGGQEPLRKQTEGEYFAATAMRLASSNSVSCEDLLEFSDKKPKGCERGVDSDEVRIMMKVLGKDSTPGRCLEALEYINWDVHKAIKIIKLQNISSIRDMSLAESVDSLHKYEWDLRMTALKLKSNKT